jgi:signal recognition particle subunit SRP54
MFAGLTDKLKQIVTSLSSRSLTEATIQEAARKVRYALLDADVNYQVASKFMQRVKEKAKGAQLLRSVKPQEQFVKIVHDELAELMGKDEAALHLKGQPAVIMLVGLQGSGKTTTTGKLASFLQKQGKKVLLAPCDRQRPAAIDQLKILSNQVGCHFFDLPGQTNPVKVAKASLKEAENEHFDLLILDTAGRLHIDKELMNELEQIKKATNPCEILFVANATSGQDAVKTAQEFDEKITITGTVLTMLDGDARAGAALSIREITNKPLKFEGVGERIEDFRPFHPVSMADRILGMGDVINLVRKAEEHVDEDEQQKLKEKFKKASFSFNDYLKQLSMIKKMGSMKGVLKMLPGASQLKDLDLSDQQFKQIEAMILSMTLEEREGKIEFDISRKKRIAKGAGLTLEMVNKILKGFKRLKKNDAKITENEKFI